MSEIESIKFFNDFQPLINSGSSNDTKMDYEKIKLEFSILHAAGRRYSIQVKFYDKQVFDFISETKRIDSKQKIVFEKFYTCNFYFGKEQNIQIIVYRNSTSYVIKTTLGHIIGSKDCNFTKNYYQDESLVIKAEKLEKDEDLLDVKLILTNESDPTYFINNKLFYLITCGDTDIYRSKAINNDGTFEPIHIPINLLRPFYTVNFYNLNNKLLLSFDNEVDNITLNYPFKKNFQIRHNSYITLTDKSEIIKNYTFMDYIQSGVKIALWIGIDFTGSNGHPMDLSSLHSLCGKNDYERAITACANIVGCYDYDQLFPVFGFGAIINAPGIKEASMCFNLNFCDDPNIYGIDNIIKVYRDCINNEKITFSGPTEFAPLIGNVISKINQDDLYEYHILMILTDGVIDDLQKTIDIIVEASFLPLSIIIVGIGTEDFTKMEILDGDDIPLTSSKGKKRARDLVQFVPFSKFQNDEQKLAMEVLAEIPRQIVEYYQFKNLNPEKIAKKLKHNDIDNKNNPILNKFSKDFKKSEIDSNINPFITKFNKKSKGIKDSEKVIKIPSIISKPKEKSNDIKDSDKTDNQIKESSKFIFDSNYFFKENSKKQSDNEIKIQPNIDILQTDRKNNSKKIQKFHLNENFDDKKSRRMSTDHISISSVSSSTRRKLNQKNPFYVGNKDTNNMYNQSNDKKNNNQRYYNMYESKGDTLKSNSSLINIGYNVISSSQNTNDTINNIKKRSFEGISKSRENSYIDLNLLHSYETIFLKKNNNQ